MPEEKKRKLRRRKKLPYWACYKTNLNYEKVRKHLIEKNWSHKLQPVFLKRDLEVWNREAPPYWGYPSALAESFLKRGFDVWSNVTRKGLIEIYLLDEETREEGALIQISPKGMLTIYFDHPDILDATGKGNFLAVLIRIFLSKLLRTKNLRFEWPPRIDPARDEYYRETAASLEM